ncbi:MAG: tetratricopeptide repeat protein, partial [Saprospiraceae bacterium]
MNDMKQRALLLSIIFLVIQNFTLGQSLKDSLFKDCKILIDSQRHVKALAQFEEIQDQFPKSGQSEMLDLYYLIALKANSNHEYETALIWWRDSILQKRISLSGTKNFKTIKTMHNIAMMYRNLGQGKKEFTSVEEIISIVQRGLEPLSSKDSISLAYKFLDYSYLYRRIEDFNKSEQCLNKAKLLMNKSSSARLNQKFNNYAGVLYSFKGNQALAKNYLLKSIANKPTKIPANSQYNLALVYYQLNQLDSAYYHCQAAKKKYVKSNNNNNLGRCFNLLGLINHKRKNYLEAYENYQTSIESFPSDLYPHSSSAIGYENIGDNYFSQQEYGQALKYYQQSLSYLSNRLNPLNTLKDNPIVSQISPTELNNAIRILGLKINALYHAYKEQKQEKYLKYALETSNTMDTLVHNFRLFNKSGEDKIT